MKKGTLVKMTDRGFHFYHNIDDAFDGWQLRGEVNASSFEQMLCESLAILGTGKVIIVESDQVKVCWKFNNAGMYFHYTMWYDLRDVRKLSLLERIKEFLC
jgi:hypothetical protein